ncbi:hypothetical protein P3911_004482 [Salmonella enterica]|nr:hypothetical protein [Salmonella enterica]
MFVHVPRGVFWTVDGNYGVTLPNGKKYTSIHYNRVLGWMPSDNGGVYPMVARHGFFNESDKHNIGWAINHLITEEDLPPEFDKLRKGDKEFSNFLNMCYEPGGGEFAGYFRNNQIGDGDFVAVPGTYCYFQQPDDLPLFARKGKYGY